MEESLRIGLMAVCAVSGSMVLLVHHVHRHLLSNFMKQFEFQMGGCFWRPHTNGRHKHNPCGLKHQKKLRFCEVASANTKNGGRKVAKPGGTSEVMDTERMVLVGESVQKWRSGPRLEDMMPPNRAVLYKGIINYRTRMGRFGF